MVKVGKKKIVMVPAHLLSHRKGKDACRNVLPSEFTLLKPRLGKE